ncbi:MAG: CRISPR-associated protein [Leptolyngbyaceae cyanobacterium RU_5_1]|nr:CRISPR-associated protein [Leptolyngbyaceae cyanobacterium RU_5_1]
MTDTSLTAYTAITFAPVQGFIEKSRKLRDLYGSSYILSYLSHAICVAADQSTELTLISPALIDVTQGTPNQILIAGHFANEQVKAIFDQAWLELVQSCRIWIEAQLPAFDYCWRRDWSLWTNHAWEFFWATGETIQAARENLNEVKHARGWTGINWSGESSTLSGADAVAFPGMSRKVNPKQRSRSQEDDEIREFYQQLSQLPDLGEATITEREQLSIPELVKRLVTIEDIYTSLPFRIEFPSSFKSESQGEGDDLDETAQPGEKRWKGWFCGDGDRAGDYLKGLSGVADEDEKIQVFSRTMREWGETLQRTLLNGRIIYAGGDDFLGVFRRTRSELKAQECLRWFYRFKSSVWNRSTDQQPKPITASVGFVWAAPNVPQREVLQQCRDAEKAAKRQGRDRLALRILFNGGNFLEWICPWHVLPVLQDYCDRTPHNGKDTWAHIYNDVAVLEARHAFQGNDAKGKPVNDCLDVALALFNVYFGPQHSPSNASSWTATDKDEFYYLMTVDLQNSSDTGYWETFFERDGLWNREEGVDPSEPTKTRLKGGILGDRAAYTQDGQPNGALDIAKAKQAFTDWIINLAKVGFHLCSDT